MEETKYKQTQRDNLTKKERIALINNENLVINKADKGNTVVVEDKTEYIKNANTHLNNPEVYKQPHLLKKKLN